MLKLISIAFALLAVSFLFICLLAYQLSRTQAVVGTLIERQAELRDMIMLRGGK